MGKYILPAILLAALCLRANIALAQTGDAGAQCGQVIAAAVNATVQSCASVERDRLCFGHAPLAAVPRPDADLRLEAPGDVAETGLIERLRLGAPSLRAGEWGMALARISANTPDEAATLLLFGGLELQNAGLDAPLVTLDARVRYRTGANVRVLPSPDAPLVASVNLGAPVRVIGRLADLSWLWVQLEDDRRGWTASELLAVEGDLNWLTVFDPAEPIALDTLYGPFQAFSLQTVAAAESLCPELPVGGLLAQTPPVDRVTLLRVNEALLAVQPESTLYLRAQPDEMAVLALEGAVEVLAAGQSRMVTAGQQVRLPLDDLAVGTAVPRLPEPYVYAEARALPVMVLPREFVIPVSVGGVIIPAQYGVNPLGAVAPDGPCTVAAFTEARLRSGPGTNYPVRALIQEGDSARPDGRAGGTDGALWWRLSPDFWVRADAVLMAGACNALPLVEAPPLPVRP